MFHAITMFFGIVVWIVILAVLVPMAYRCAMRHQDAIKDGCRAMKRMLGR